MRVGGDEDDILHQAQFFKNPDEPSGGVRLRPVHAVTGGAGEGVVVIVPAFSHGQDAKEEIVSASIGCFKGAATEGVADRVDRQVMCWFMKRRTKPPQTSPPKAPIRIDFPKNTAARAPIPVGTRRAVKTQSHQVLLMATIIGSLRRAGA